MNIDDYLDSIPHNEEQGEYCQCRACQRYETVDPSNVRIPQKMTYQEPESDAKSGRVATPLPPGPGIIQGDE